MMQRYNAFLQHTVSTDRRTGLVACLWGFAEGTFLFLIPDVFISYAALWSTRRALLALAFSLLGSLIAGTVLFLIATLFPHPTSDFLFTQPGITTGMYGAVTESFEGGTLPPIPSVAFAGIPYRVYTLAAATIGSPFLVFLAWSLLARVARLAVPIGVALVLGRLLRRRANTNPARYTTIHLMVWVMVYVVWFYLVYQAYPNI